MTQPFRLEPLSKSHDRNSFRCGDPALDSYFRTQASQDVKRQLAACFVLIENSTEKIAGFFTLSAASIPLSDLPDAERKKVGKYAAVPAARVGRLATHSGYQGQGLGTAMLARAMHYAATSPVACFAVLVDAKDEAAARFYERHGYIRFTSRPLTLFLAVKTVQAMAPKAP